MHFTRRVPQDERPLPPRPPADGGVFGQPGGTAAVTARAPDTPGCVLLIEDDDRIADMVSRTLAAEGYAVDRAQTGPDGLRMALDGAFDLVILDLMLPGMPGTSVLNHLMRHRPDQRVLVLSAVTGAATRVACLESGAADFVAKPFALTELVARVRARLRAAPPGPAPDVLTVGPVQLDLRQHRARVSGDLISLSPRELVLLGYLMRRAGEVCSRSELLRYVWNSEFDPGSNIVDVNIKRLRAKLDHPDRIATVRSVGYRFDPH
ncbi:response regulator transcription factor [Allocatelliglobosispora scoriae]|nr:response regulator transcription factor [Allocatelliglobosispora scoriae]